MKKSMWFRSKLNKSGFSLIEVLVAVGISTILMMAMMAMIEGQGKDVKKLTEKLTTTEVQSLVQKVFLNSSYCTCLMSAYTFDSGTNTWNSFPSNLPASYGTACATSSGSLVAVGSFIGNTQVRVSAIQMNSISEIVAGTGNYLGNLRIDFDPSTTLMPLKGIDIPVSFAVNLATPANARALVSCGNGDTPKNAIIDSFSSGPIPGNLRGNRFRHRVINQTVNIPAGVTKVIAQVNLISSCLGSQSNGDITIRKNGVNVFAGGVSLYGNYSTGQTHTWIDTTPTVGNVAYEVWTGNTHGSGCAWTSPGGLTFTLSAQY